MPNTLENVRHTTRLGKRSIAVSAVLCQLPLPSHAAGGILPAPQTATGRPAEQVNIDALQKKAQLEGESGQTAEAIRDYQSGRMGAIAR